mgnify:CR=1 FL=1
MEVLAALGVGSLAWLAVYILLGKTHRRGALGSNQSTIMVLRYACRRLAECPGICRIAHLPSVALLRDELRRFSWIQRNSFSDDEIVGMILFGLMSIPVLFALICSSVIGIGIGLVVAIASCLVLVRMVNALTIKYAHLVVHPLVTIRGWQQVALHLQTQIASRTLIIAAFAIAVVDRGQLHRSLRIRTHTNG